MIDKDIIELLHQENLLLQEVLALVVIAYRTRKMRIQEH